MRKVMAVLVVFICTPSNHQILLALHLLQHPGSNGRGVVGNLTVLIRFCEPDRNQHSRLVQIYDRIYGPSQKQY